MVDEHRHGNHQVMQPVAELLLGPMVHERSTHMMAAGRPMALETEPQRGLLVQRLRPMDSNKTRSMPVPRLQDMEVVITLGVVQRHQHINSQRPVTITGEAISSGAEIHTTRRLQGLI